jgi:hypothetical protein
MSLEYIDNAHKFTENTVKNSFKQVRISKEIKEIEHIIKSHKRKKSNHFIFDIPP